MGRRPDDEMIGASKLSVAARYEACHRVSGRLRPRVRAAANSAAIAMCEWLRSTGLSTLDPRAPVALCAPMAW